MQRANPVTEIIGLIREVREDIIGYLGKQYHYIAEENENAYVFPHDTSGHLTRLQAIVGEVLMTSEHAPSLLDILRRSITLATKEQLFTLIQALRTLLLPIPDFPPIKYNLKSLIESSADKLIVACLIIEFELNKEFDADAVNASETHDKEIEASIKHCDISTAPTMTSLFAKCLSNNRDTDSPEDFPLKPKSFT
jgi:hypothetical protein